MKPSHINENKLKPVITLHYKSNYETNYEVFALVLEKLLKMQGKTMMLRQLNREIKVIETSADMDRETKNKKVEALRNKYVQKYLFVNILIWQKVQ